MPYVPYDVPAHVQHADHIQNHVRIEAGTNWDHSRTARATPIAPVSNEEAAPEPLIEDREHLAHRHEHAAAAAVHEDLPAGDPLLVVAFAHESITLQREHRRALLALPRDVPLVVVGRGDASESDANRLARVRAKAVTSFLRENGFIVMEVKALGSAHARLERGANRAVEIYSGEALQVGPEA